MQLLRKIKFNKTKLDTYYTLNPDQLAVSIGSSRKRLLQRDVITGTKALAKGLQQQRFIPGDTILVRLSHQNLLEKLMIKIAASTINVKIISSKANNIQQLEKQLKQTRARGFVFTSYSALGDTTIIDSLYRLIPEMSQAPYNSQIMSSRLIFLKCLIQTDDYKLKGAFNINKLYKYVSNFEYQSDFDCNQDLIQIQNLPDLKRPILITDPCSDLAFRAGVLNMLVNGKLLLCSSPDLIRAASEFYNHELDIICTENIGQIHNKSGLCIQAGNNMYEKHPNRKQILL